MAGLVPAIHVLCDRRQAVDALELEKLITLVESMDA